MFPLDQVTFNSDYLQECGNWQAIIDKHTVKSVNEFYLMIYSQFDGVNATLALSDFKKYSRDYIYSKLIDENTGDYKDCAVTSVLLDERNSVTNQSISFDTTISANKDANALLIDWIATYPISLFIAILETFNKDNINAFYFSKAKSFNKNGIIVNTIVFLLELKIQGTLSYHYYDYSQDPPTRNY